MRKMIPAALLITALAAIPAFAAQTAAGSKPKPTSSGAASVPHASMAKPASHSTSGKVKSVDATTLVLAKGGKDMTFMIDSSTTKEGTIDVGSDVVVRYHADGKQNMATAITAKPAKPKK